ncbi:hypothetical protein BJ742DRAFT_770798 [Cladochytrium replicatum]|nr:hypothetical protein BJ742DRAFT_770798 [Cladochytrium replicatum]
MVGFSFGDVCLRDDDLDLLEEGEWINDAIIDFYYEYLEDRTRQVASGVRRSEIVFLRPTMVFLLANVQDPSDIAAAAPPGLKEAELVFIPVNDNTSLTLAGGSHWSLLVFHRSSGTFYYYDTLGQYSEKAARRVHQKMAEFLLPRAELNAGVTNAHFVNIGAQTQDNGWDCGVFVIYFTKVLWERWRDSTGGKWVGQPGELGSWRVRATPQQIRDMRKQIKRCILDLSTQVNI